MKNGEKKIATRIAKNRVVSQRIIAKTGISN